MSANAAVGWLLGTGVVLLGAHLFSDILARVAATSDDPNWAEIISIGHEDVAVLYGAVGMALIMSVAALADLDSENALLVSVVVGLLALAGLCFYGLSHHRLLTRAVMSVAAAGLALVIVTLENAF